jgi:methionine-rich copper-binding protein CopC
MKVGRTVLILAALTAVAVVGGASRNASATQAPIEMKFACALKSNGLVRYVSNLNQCKSTEEKVTINPGPITVCVNPDGTVRKIPPYQCQKPGVVLTLPPASGIVYFCAANSNGQLRYVTSPSQCTSKEFPVFVQPNDQAPAVATNGTTPANGATNVAVNTNITIKFTEAVTFSDSSFTLQCPSGTPKSFSSSGSGTDTATLDPTVDLPQGTTCAVKVIAGGIHDVDTLDPPDTMAADYNFSFTTDSAPTVSSTSPANSATGVNPSNNITVTFSEPVNATTSSFSVECPSGTPETFAVTGSGTSTITIDPTFDLPASTTCTVTVVAGGISDVDSGDPPDNLAANYVFSFTTADAAPSVTTTSPADGADHVAVNTNIVVNFSESVTVSSSSFTLECPTGSSKSFAVSGSPGSSITLNPTSDLPEGTTCTVTAVAANISDTDAVDPPDHPAANYSFSFTTDSAPTITSHSPADGATDVAANTNITFTFSEPVTVDSSSFTIVCDGNPQTFQVSGSGTSSITLDPDSDLPTAHCTVTAVAANISDVDTGDPPDHPAANSSFTFATADAGPSVTTTSPADAADHVAVNTNIVVNFSEPVTASGSSFSLECPTGTPESFSVSGSPGSSITLDPTSDLPEGTVCSVKVIASGISDVDTVDPPDNMAADYNFSFTTDSAPAVTTTSPADNATDVATSANITVNFNEPVDVTTSSFTISCNSNPQTFQVSGSGTDSITLDPDSDLPSTASCTVTSVAANISDTDTGDPPDHPAANHSFSFTTQDAAPSVSTTTPADGATDVARDTTIQINFSESVSATNNAFTIECPTGTSKAFSQTSSPATSFTLTPSANLPAGTVCTITVHKDEISDTDAVDPPDNMAADYVFSFTTKANVAPTDIQLSNNSIAENQPSGTDIGTLTTTDPDVGDTHTYTLESSGCGGGPFPDNSSFQIGGVSNDKLQSAASFNFEVKSSYTVCVRSTDSGALSFDKQFTISVTNVNEPPTDITLSNNSIDENKASGSAVGNLSQVGDPDSGETYTFTLLTSGCSGSFPDSSSFQVSGSQLQSAVSFNYEVKNSYTICVRVNDPGSPNLSFEKSFTISINDVNDPPVAVADGPYNGVIGNTLAVLGTTASGPKVVLTGNVLTANDTDEDTGVFAHALSAVAETPTSTGGGTATINTDGSFTFMPGVGDKNQNDTFTYHVTDGTATTAGTVTVHIENFLVWYVNNASAAATHDGRSPSPFLNLSSLNGAGGSGDSDGTGDYIFLYQGSGSYGGGIPLEANQNLWGEPHGLTVNGNNLVAAGGSNPVVTNAGGVGVGLASGADVEGLNISGTSGDAVNGVGVTTATVGTTTAVNISSAGGDGVDLSGAAGGNISIAAPIADSAGLNVSVAGRNSGTVAFSGALSDSTAGTGGGVSLSGNTGATINLTGGVVASTTTNPAFSATGGGTVNVTGSANTLTTTTGTALNVANTNIGASGLNFRSIASNGAASGIILNTTGASGGLTVSGNGSAGTGGTITASTGPGISLTSTSSPSFSWMNVQNGGDDGIRGTTVSGLTLSNMNVSGNGNAVGERGIELNGLTGTATIGSSTFTGSAEDNANIVNSSGSLNLSVTGSTFSNTSALTGNDGILISSNDSAAVTASITGSTFNHNRGDQFQFATNTSSTGSNTVTFSNNTLTDDRGSTHGGTDLGGGVSITQDGGADVAFTLANNNVQGAVDTALKVDMGTGSTAGALVSGTISGNTIGTAATADSGSAQNNGISVTSQNFGTETVSITGNTVRQYNLNGINIVSRLGAPTENATITGNTVGNPGGFALNGILVSAGASSTGNNGGNDAGTICAGIGGAGALANSITGAGTNGADPTATDFRVRQRFATTVKLPGYGGSTTDDAAVVTFVKGNNGGTPTGSATHSVPPGGGFIGGTACATP